MRYMGGFCMCIAENYNIENKKWELEDTLNFIETCLLAFEKIYVKDINKLVCYEEEYDTLDFNQVPYLLRNEYEISENIIKEIKKFETIVKQLYIKKEIIGETINNNIYFLLEFNNKIYSICYSNNVMSFSKMKIKNINDKNLIKFKTIEQYIKEENITKFIKK